MSKGGATHNITVSSGGALNVAGTVTSAVLVMAGGSNGVVGWPGYRRPRWQHHDFGWRSGCALRRHAGLCAGVKSGGSLNVSSGGKAHDITVSSGGNLNVAGTTTSNVTVDSGGTETVLSGGIASGTTIAGGTLEIPAAVRRRQGDVSAKRTLLLVSPLSAEPSRE